MAAEGEGKGVTHSVFRSNQNMSAIFSSLHSPSRIPSSRSTFSNHSNSLCVIWFCSPPSKPFWGIQKPQSQTYSPADNPSSNSLAINSPCNASLCNHPCRLKNWPSYGNSSTSPMSHKFSGMGMWDIFNVTPAQKMDILGMDSTKPMDMSTVTNKWTGPKQSHQPLHTENALQICEATKKLILILIC